jgi:hypothetical protein
MSIRCKLGWHDWEETEFAVYDPSLPLDPPRHPGFRYEQGRECCRCFKRQIYRPGLHHPPYWHDYPENL